MAATAAVFAAGAGAQEKIELKFSHYAPPVLGFQVDIIEPWIADLEKRTGGKLTARIFAANSPFGNIANQADQVKAGVTAIAWGLNGVPRGRFPRAMIIDLPFMASSSNAASKTLWSMRAGLLADDYKDFKLIALHCHPAGGSSRAPRKSRRSTTSRACASVRRVRKSRICSRISAPCR